MEKRGGGGSGGGATLNRLPYSVLALLIAQVRTDLALA